MAKAQSLENNLYPFGKLASTDAENTINDDFPYKNFETYKFKAVSTNGATVNYKANFNILKKSENYSGEGQDEFKVVFPVNGTSILARILTNRKGDLEGHVDFGNKQIAKKDFNLFANFKTNFSFDSITVRTGANYFSDKINSSTHVESDLTKHSLWQRITGSNNKASYGLALKVGGTGSLVQYDAVVGYKDKDFDVYIKHLTDAKNANGIKPQVVSLETLYRIKDYTVAVVAQKDLQNSSAAVKSVSAGVAGKIDDKTNVKAKIDKALNLGLSVKYKHNASYTFTVGANVPVGAKEGGSTGILPFDLGLQVDLNV